MRKKRRKGREGGREEKQIKVYSINQEQTKKKSRDRVNQ